LSNFHRSCHQSGQAASKFSTREKLQQRFCETAAHVGPGAKCKFFFEDDAIMTVFVRSVAAVALMALITCGLTGCGGSKDNKMGDPKMTDGKMGDGKMMDGKMSDGKMMDGKMMDGKMDGKMMDDKEKMK
jgi:hypothetical protein